MPPMSTFAQTIYAQKYQQPGEEWPDTAYRVASNVMGPYLPELVDEVTQLITERKFMPGGRYLYAAGKPVHQTQNCLLMDVEDSREGWADLMYKVTSGLMTGAGVGVVYSKLRERGAPVRGMGGQSTGPIATMQMVNETGRHIMQGGSRRSALWAGLHWNHPDVFEFITLKDWSDDIRAAKLKDYNYPAPMDGTNISVILDDEFFYAYDNRLHHKHDWAHRVYDSVVEHMLTTAEPGFSVDTGANAGEHLRNAPVTGETQILTRLGYCPVDAIKDREVTVWTGKQWAKNVKFLETNPAAGIVKVEMTGGRIIRCDPTHEFLVERYDGLGRRRKLIAIDRVRASDLKPGDILHVSLSDTVPAPYSNFSNDAYTLGFLFGDGSFRGKRAELTLCTDEKKACLPYLSGYDHIIDPDSRGYARLYWHDGYAGLAKTQCPQFITSNATVGFLAGLFDADGNWEPKQKRIRLSSIHSDFLRGVARLLEEVGIIAHVSKAGRSTYGKSQTYQLVIASEYSARFAVMIPTKRIKPDLDGYRSYRPSFIKVISVEPDGVEPVYCADVNVDEHSFMAEGVIISNCTEITSYDDSDICNLGSLNLAAFDHYADFERAVEVSTAFLLCGTLYSTVPYAKVDEIRTKNRRLGLGIMGIYEWLVTRGYRYGPNNELAYWLDAYATSTEIAADYADWLSISRPIKTRAIAPTGTIGILAETTTGMEPLFTAAMKRRYLKGDTWHFQYVVDATAKRLIDKGVDLFLLEDAYDLANDPARRLEFQAWLQQWVDHGISSTINLPSPDEQSFTPAEFGKILMEHLPQIRGVTCYPDGARGGQPLTKVPLQEALDWEGLEYEEVGNGQACLSGVCGV